MSEFKLSIPYMTLQHGNVRAFYIVWGILGVISACLIFTLIPSLGLLDYLPSHSINLLTIWFVMILGGVPYVFIPYQVFVLSKEGNRLYASKDGTVFSPFTGRGLRFRYSRKWSDFGYATVECADPTRIKPDDYLLLNFKSGGFARLKLAKMHKKDVEQFLMAIELLAPECTRSPELLVFQDFLQNENKGLEGYSYTKIWEDELARRFNSTSFVPLSPGDKLNYKKLTVQQQLAFGGFSAVYLVEDEVGNKQVLKESVLPPSSSQEARSKASELFEREGKILERLAHEGIARINGTFAESGRRYMLLDYVHGKNLRQLVRLQGLQSVETALQWGLQMCDMLDYLHEQAPPVMHRDFTPDNLVLKDDGSLVLVDFGAANEFISTATGTLIGKQCYMPSEQVRGKSVPQSDLYALGATLYFVLTGKDPVALSACRPSKVVEVPPELDGLIASLTHLEVQKRPQSASEVKRLIAAVIARIQKDKNSKTSRPGDTASRDRQDAVDAGSSDADGEVGSDGGEADSVAAVVGETKSYASEDGVVGSADAKADQSPEGQTLSLPGKRELA